RIDGRHAIGGHDPPHAELVPGGAGRASLAASSQRACLSVWRRRRDYRSGAAEGAGDAGYGTGLTTKTPLACTGAAEAEKWRARARQIPQRCGGDDARTDTL